MADILTFLDLQNRVYRWIDEAVSTGGSTSSKTTAIVKDAINASHRRLCMKRQWPFMRWPRTESFTTSLDVKAYAIKPDVRKILTIWDVTRRIYVPVIPEREWPAEGVDLSRTAAVPWGVTFGASWPVSVQPTVATAITVLSSSGSDVTTSVVIEGLDASGDMQSETLTINGTTPVVSVGTYLFVTSVTKVGTWVGTLALKYGSTVALTLLPAATAKIYPTIEFLESPEGGRQFLYTFERTPKTLVYDNDIPHTPYPFSEMHVYDTLIDLVTYNTELGLKEQSIWKDRLEELKDGLETAMDTKIAGSQPRVVRDVAESAGGSRTLVSNF